MAKNRSGGSGLGWIVLIALGFLAYKFRHELVELGGLREAAAPPASVPDATASYARAPLQDSWPPLEQAASGAPSAARATLNYYVVLDGSGSMRETECGAGKRKIAAAVTALEQFVSQVPKEANVGLLVFDDAGISERVPLDQGNHAAVRAALQGVRAKGGTPLKSAIAEGYDKLLAQARRQLGYGEYHLVVVTDGKPEPSDEDPSELVGTLLATTPVVLHTIGFCIGTDHVLNQPGRSYYVAAESPEQLQQGLSAVLAEAPAFDQSQFGD